MLLGLLENDYSEKVVLGGRQAFLIDELERLDLLCDRLQVDAH